MTNLQHALTELLGPGWTVTDVSVVGGGCISEARKVSVRDRQGNARRLFVKSNAASFEDNFQSEWDGLVRLSQPEVIGVPQPVAVGIAEGRAWLVTDWVDQGSAGRGFYQKFGCALAQLHRSTIGSQIGLDHENFLGSARQINTPRESWNQFVADQRIGFQIRWAIDQGLASRGLQRDCDQIIEAMDDLLDGREDQTSLLHGDLWSGNYLSDRQGEPVIIDPAVYYGCPEAEFGMLRLFGSCPADFYESYLDTFPLPAGWQRRVNLYVLYHLLNHLNLFGTGYLGQCETLAAEILRQ